MPVHPRGQGVHPSGQGSCDASVADEGGLYASQPPDLALLLAAEGTSLVGHRRLVSKGRAVLLPKVTPERFCVLQHGSRDAVMLGVFEPYPTQASRWLELEQLGIWVRHQNRRVSGNDELRSAPVATVVEYTRKAELPLGRERRLGFVEEVQPVPDAVDHHVEESLPVRASVEGATPVPSIGITVDDSPLRICRRLVELYKHRAP